MAKRSIWVFAIILTWFMGQGISMADSAKKYTMGFYCIAPPFAPAVAIMEQMGKELEKETDGAVNVKLFSAGQIGNEAAGLNSLKLGVVQTAAITGLAISTIEPLANALMMPFVFKNYEDVEKFTQSKTLAIISESLEKNGMKLMGVGSYGFFNILSIKKNIGAIDDLKGVKIRVYPAPTLVDLYKGLGASPTPIAFPEIYTGLQQGVIEATDGTMDSSYTSKQYEVAKFLTRTDHIHGWFLYIANKDWLEKLPDDIKTSVINNFAKYCAIERQDQQKYENKILETYTTAGLKITRLNDQERAAFIKATEPVHTMYREKMDANYIDQFYKETGYKP